MSMQGACEGLRILDLTHGMAGPLATMILADFGAEVVRVESPERVSDWDEAAYLLLQRGKKSVPLDLHTDQGRSDAADLAAGMDVVIESLGAGVADRAGIGYGTLSATNPRLVYCSISSFGRSGPLAGIKADDGLVMAKAGILRDQPGWFGGDRPVYRAPRDGSYFAAMLAVQGILAAVRARDLTGKGQLVETSMLQALCCRQNPKVRWLLREGESLPVESGSHAAAKEDEHSLAHHRDPREINLIGMRVQCKDGRWMVHSHTEPHFFPAWIKVLGFDWIWEDERFKGAPHQFPDEDAKVELVRLVTARMQEKSSTEWMQAYLANGNVCGDVIQTTQEALRHPQMVETGNVLTVDDPRVGEILQVGPLAKIPGAPATVRGPAPLPGLDNLESVLSERGESAASFPDPVRRLSGPLEGVTIIECAYYYATPFATALLADLGARVIKIEPLKGDPYRLLGGDPYNLSGGGTDPVLNLGHNNMVRAMQGKESIALNLKDERGQKILHGLVASADVFVHSFRPGVPESLGIDYDTLRKINPTLVYQYGASYGSTGPYSRQPAIDPIIAAFAGTTVHQAGEGNPPLTETGADPVAAAGHAAAMVLGLFARHRTGKGQHVESSMIVSNIYLNCDDALSYEGKLPRTSVDNQQFGTAPARRLYETAGPSAHDVSESYENPDSRWVFLSAEGDEEFFTFCKVADRLDLTEDERFSTARARDQNRVALSEILQDVFKSRSAREWEAVLLSAGVACVTADAMSHFAFLYRDPQAVSNGLMVETEHPTFGGRYWRHAPMLRFSETPAAVRPHCELGEHTRALLEELGYDQSEAAELRQADVVAWPTPNNETVSTGS